MPEMPVSQAERLASLAPARCSSKRPFIINVGYVQQVLKILPSVANIPPGWLQLQELGHLVEDVGDLAVFHGRVLWVCLVIMVSWNSLQARDTHRPSSNHMGTNLLLRSLGFFSNSCFAHILSNFAFILRISAIMSHSCNYFRSLIQFKSSGFPK